jgi:hypothetical protein
VLLVLLVAGAFAVGAGADAGGDDDEMVVL